WKTLWKTVSSEHHQALWNAFQITKFLPEHDLIPIYQTAVVALTQANEELSTTAFAHLDREAIRLNSIPLQIAILLARFNTGKARHAQLACEKISNMIP